MVVCSKLLRLSWPWDGSYLGIMVLKRSASAPGNVGGPSDPPNPCGCGAVNWSGVYDPAPDSRPLLEKTDEAGRQTAY